MAYYREEYRELIESARDAMRELLRETEPGTGLGLHTAYNTLKKMLELDKAPSRSAAADEVQTKTGRSVDEWNAERKARRAGWVPLSKHARERLVIELIGEGRLTVREVIDQLKRQHDTSWLHYGDVYPTLKSLLDKGELDRKPQPPTASSKAKCTVWAYFRKDMSGPIADLERAYHDDEEAA